jgi:putative ABC transport system substrate-binding protein
MRRRLAAALLFAVVLLTAFGRAGDSWAQTKIARVGILTVDAVTVWKWAEPFRRTLADQGWIEGRTASFEMRSAGGDPPHYAEAAAELVGLRVDVIWATNAPATRAAYEATHTIPIVAADLTNDPIAAGYIESYSRPGGNLTGVFLDAPGFAGKWLELLKAILPGLSRAVVLWDPGPGAAHLQAVQGAARSFGVQLQVIEIRKPEDIDRAPSAFRGRPQALIILPSPMTYVQSERLAKLALKHRLPATSMFRQFAEAGGAVSYGPDQASAYERCAVLVAKVLGGAKPGELPVERPTKFELVVNLKTARALGLTIPDSVLLGADQVIR